MCIESIHKLAKLWIIYRIPLNPLPLFDIFKLFSPVDIYQIHRNYQHVVDNIVNNLNFSFPITLLIPLIMWIIDMLFLDMTIYSMAVATFFKGVTVCGKPCQ
ncbi:Uncharacterised protein [Chlamydia abortus]|nr:Uncharacterised protein [Chlamydia abortus]